MWDVLEILTSLKVLPLGNHPTRLQLRQSLVQFSSQRQYTRCTGGTGKNMSYHQPEGWLDDHWYFIIWASQWIRWNASLTHVCLHMYDGISRPNGLHDLLLFQNSCYTLLVCLMSSRPQNKCWTQCPKSPNGGEGRCRDVENVLGDENALCLKSGKAVGTRNHQVFLDPIFDLIEWYPILKSFKI